MKKTPNTASGVSLCGLLNTLDSSSLEKEQWLARRFAIVAACRVGSKPAWGRFLNNISCFSPLNVETLLRCLCLWEQHMLHLIQM